MCEVTQTKLIYLDLSRLCSVVSSLKGRGETVLNVR